jgi:hypothetical protein
MSGGVGPKELIQVPDFVEMQGDVLGEEGPDLLLVV